MTPARGGASEFDLTPRTSRSYSRTLSLSLGKRGSSIRKEPGRTTEERWPVGEETQRQQASEREEWLRGAGAGGMEKQKERRRSYFLSTISVSSPPPSQKAATVPVMGSNADEAVESYGGQSVTLQSRWCSGRPPAGCNRRGAAPLGLNPLLRCERHVGERFSSPPPAPCSSTILSAECPRGWGARPASRTPIPRHGSC